MSAIDVFGWRSLGLAFIVLVAVAFPFWVVSIPPVTDLPQHLGQIFLLEETLAGRRQIGRASCRERVYVLV